MAAGNASSPVASVEPESIDILLGKGTPINIHPGNIVFRRAIADNHDRYDNESEGRKYLVARDIVDKFYSQGSRFLQKDRGSGVWVEVPKRRAYGKAQQTLRDGAPKRREKKIAARKAAMKSSGQAQAQVHLLVHRHHQGTGDPPKQSRKETLSLVPGSEHGSYLSSSLFSPTLTMDVGALHPDQLPHLPAVADLDDEDFISSLTSDEIHILDESFSLSDFEDFFS